MDLIFFKDVHQEQTISAPFALTKDEIIKQTQVIAITPQTREAMLTAEPVSGPKNQVLFVLNFGEEGTTYRIVAKVFTNFREENITLVVHVNRLTDSPFLSVEPKSFQDLIGSLDAGQSAVSTAIFTFPPEIDPTGGYVTWELLDEKGFIYSSSNSYSYDISQQGSITVVSAKCLVSVPENTPPSVDRPYQIRYTLHLNSDLLEQNLFYSYENLTVTTLDIVPVGAFPSIEKQGDTAILSIVLDRMYDIVVCEIYNDNDLIASIEVNEAERVATGYRYSCGVNTGALAISLVPYKVIWQYRQGSNPTFRENTQLWIVNASILDAMSDMLAKVNKARMSLYGTDDMQYLPESIMLWLRRGMDAFNGYKGIFTSFTMINAKRGIRDYWLLFAEKFAIEAQYLAEGEKAFDFQGANISLNVDKTQYLDTALGRIEARLDNELDPMKRNLVIRGNTSGDGSVDPQGVQAGAHGKVGITISPTMQFSRAVSPLNAVLFHVLRGN